MVDYSENAYVMVMASSRTGNKVMMKPRIGEVERRTINAGARLAKVIGASGIALPIEAVITPGKTVLHYGARLETERDITAERFARDLVEIVEEGVIRYVAVLRIKGFPYAYVMYGRDDFPEYWATVYVGKQKPVKEACA